MKAKRESLRALKGNDFNLKTSSSSQGSHINNKGSSSRKWPFRQAPSSANRWPKRGGFLGSEKRWRSASSNKFEKTKQICPLRAVQDGRGALLKEYA